MTGRWRPTAGLIRAALASLTLTVVALLAGRVDLLVLGVPLLVVALGGVRHRPGAVPVADARLAHRSLREGEGTTLRVTLDRASGVEHAAVALAPHPWVGYRPPSGVAGATAAAPGDRIDVTVPLASLRWGARHVGGGLVAATSAWGGFRWGPAPLLASPLTTLPLPGRFDTKAPPPHPIGLVGTHPSRRPGDGSELAGIRPFAPGDRVRRVHWPVSLRTGTLHVTSAVAEEDSSVLLLLDAGTEVGAPGGIGDPPSSLDQAVRAAGAIAEHYLRRGDRVGLRVLGTTERSVAVAAGRRHLRRVLDTLARVVPGESRRVDPSRLRFGVPAGAVVIVLSPMLAEEAVTATLTLARRGLTVVVVDTIPADVVPAAGGGEEEQVVRLAWRLRLLERQTLLETLRHAGVPVVGWRGPGTLDEVLVQLGRRASRPRTVRR